ncbi:unnamed protein product [Kuraishia capsulata CBS 1993]|uniref:Uncharacterized protein n=1 Tax=Kuraishia capsulata CBS 1993 TaxID=1382522 RepID=W6MLQ0_9ASCO|nr:uncharacterized protein KUCA_T00003422001 [Kuraishia capsulata CBS 1993]CDK27444.1 unnamed protein product [Kuraishia capsulata CBS 1993]
MTIDHDIIVGNEPTKVTLKTDLHERQASVPSNAKRGIVTLERIILNTPADSPESACIQTRAILAQFSSDLEFEEKLQIRLPRLLEKVLITGLDYFLAQYAASKENEAITSSQYNALVCCCESIMIVYCRCSYHSSIPVAITGDVLEKLWKCCIAVYKEDYERGDVTVSALVGILSNSDLPEHVLSAFREDVVISMRSTHGSRFKQFVQPLTEILNIEYYKGQTPGSGLLGSNSPNSAILHSSNGYVMGEQIAKEPKWIEIFNADKSTRMTQRYQEIGSVSHQLTQKTVNTGISGRLNQTLTAQAHTTEGEQLNGIERFWENLRSKFVRADKRKKEMSYADHCRLFRVLWARFSEKFWNYWYPLQERPASRGIKTKAHYHQRSTSNNRRKGPRQYVVGNLSRRVRKKKGAGRRRAFRAARSFQHTHIKWPSYIFKQGRKADLQRKLHEKAESFAFQFRGHFD